MSLKCNKCGEIIDRNQSFCPSCGNKVEPQKKNIVKKPLEMKKNRAIILIAVFIVIIAIIGLWGIASNNHANNQNIVNINGALFNIPSDFYDADFNSKKGNEKMYGYNGTDYKNLAVMISVMDNGTLDQLGNYILYTDEQNGVESYNKSKVTINGYNGYVFYYSNKNDSSSKYYYYSFIFEVNRKPVLIAVGPMYEQNVTNAINIVGKFIV
ncbi:MAG: zinc ribbon domain-containing protein [Methanobacteriaceae archaeon]